MAGIRGAARLIVKSIGELLATAPRHVWKRQLASSTPGLHLLTYLVTSLCVQTYVATHIEGLRRERELVPASSTISPTRKKTSSWMA